MAQAPELSLRSDLRVGDIASSEVVFDVLAQGIEVARFFEENPESPGVIVSKNGKFYAAISHADFLRAISRQFGSELFHRRSIEAVLEFLHHKPLLILQADCLIPEAVACCLARKKNEVFGPFLVEQKKTGHIRMVDFRSLIMASSEVFAFRNQQLADEMQERKILEQKLLRAQRMETLGLIAGGIAHNLNNTLGPIMMAASMLRSDLPGELHADFVKTIEDAAQRAADIIGQLLAFSRGVGGKHRIFSPANLVREVDKFVKMTFPKSITFFSRLGDDLHNIEGDQTQLNQVLLNLCINARDAMPQGGAITISAENCIIDETFDYLPAECKMGYYVCLKVMDTGCGIPPEVIDKIFDPFFTTKDIGKGTGLGLSTAVGILQSHNGFMRAASNVGEGTTFTIYVPATEKAPIENEDIPHERVPQGNGEWILVVDDEEPIRVSAELILKRNGYRVSAACNGSEAMEIYKKRREDITLVLTDISMPLMDGISLCREIKEADPNARVVVMSGRIDQNYESSLMRLGITSRLWKPYRAEQLLKTIHACLHEHSSLSNASTREQEMVALGRI